MIETAFHEVGHNLGLSHPDKENNVATDPMGYHPERLGANFSLDQMQEILLSPQNRGVNSVKMNEKFGSLSAGQRAVSTNERPFRSAPSQSALVPAPIINPNK